MKCDVIENFAKQHNGILKTSDAEKLGVSKQYFYEFISKRGYKPLARGVYLAPDSWEDSMYALQQRFCRAVFSHETALYLLGLSEREPFRYEVTVPHGYNATNLKRQNTAVYSVKPEWHSLGIINGKTVMGNSVKLYNAERTLCDIFKSNCHIEIQDRQFAVKEYVRRKEKNIPLLLEFAETLRVEKAVKQYLEVLL